MTSEQASVQYIQYVPFLGRGTFGSGWQRQIELGDSPFQASGSCETDGRGVLEAGFPESDSRNSERPGYFGDS